MKKLIVLIFIVLLFNINIKVNKNVSAVFNENNTIYNTYYLDVSDINITTKNFNKYFNSDVIGIEGKLNSLYETKFNSLYYEFNNDTCDNNLLRYESYINKLLFNNGYKYDSYKITINGVRIKGVVIYTTIDKINEIINKYKYVTYKVLD